MTVNIDFLFNTKQNYSNHVFFLTGKAGQVIQKRGGQTLKEFLDDTSYDYGSPNVQRYKIITCHLFLIRGQYCHLKNDKLKYIDEL